MLGSFGFSWVGLAFVLCLLGPNLCYYFLMRPKDEVKIQPDMRLLVAERLGQGLCVFCLLFFRNYDYAFGQGWPWWGVAAVFFMALYLAGWLRYFMGKGRFADTLRPFLGVPIPLAVFPVLAILFMGVYGQVLWLILSALVLGVGHIGNAWQLWKAAAR